MRASGGGENGRGEGGDETRARNERVVPGPQNQNAGLWLTFLSGVCEPQMQIKKLSGPGGERDIFPLTSQGTS